MELAQFREKLEAVKWLKDAADYEVYYELMDGITGEEGAEWLDCLLDSICLEEDYGPYETLYNAIYRFPPEVVGACLAAKLPVLLRRMENARGQVGRFYISVHQWPQCQAAFLQAAKEWDKAGHALGVEEITNWCRGSAEEQEEWSPILTALGVLRRPHRPQTLFPKSSTGLRG